MIWFHLYRNGIENESDKAVDFINYIYIYFFEPNFGVIKI